MISAESIRLIQAVQSVASGRADVHAIAWYVSRCDMAGFAKTDDQRRACALRYMAGKRKVSPPGTRKRKADARVARKWAASMPAKDAAVLAEVCASDMAAQYKAGNKKALNAMVGAVVKACGAPAAAVRDEIVRRLSNES